MSTHFAKLETSPRLIRVFNYLLMSDKPRSTREIIQGANVCAVNSDADELRDNGYEIRCTRQGRVWFYELVL